VDIYNSLGQLVKHSTGSNEISVAELQSGVYFLRISAEGGVVVKTERLIKR
jgi:hypothetical protein